MNRERLIADAKALRARARARGLPAAAPRTAIPVGGESVLAALKLGVHLAWRAGRISDHDALVGRTLAHDPRRRRAAASDDGQRAVPARSRARSVPEAVRRAQDAGADSAHAEDRQAAAGTDDCDRIRCDRTRQRRAARADSWHSGPLGIHARRRSTRWRQRFRVLTFSLGGERASDAPLDRRAASTTTSIRSTRCSIAAASSAAIVCGVSFGGLIALRFAARACRSGRGAGARVDARARAGICGRGTRSTRAARGCSGRCSSPRRRAGCGRSCARALPDAARARCGSRCAQLGTLLPAPISLSRDGRRARGCIGAHDVAADCARVTAPTLVVTGERGARSRRAGRRHVATTSRLIAGARARRARAHRATSASITRPDAFARRRPRVRRRATTGAVADAAA